jgi:CheY-like chemotaxis protein
MDGAATIRAISRLNPDLPIVACSGLFTSNAEIDRLGSVKGFLLKPFTATKLLTMLHDALHSKAPRKETIKA